MPKSATEVMQDILFSAVVDALVALRSGAKGVPNALLRDVGAVHPNVTMGDLPDGLQSAIGESVRQAFARLRKEGYAVSPLGSAPPPRPPRPADPTRPPRDPSRPPRDRRDAPPKARRPRPER